MTIHELDTPALLCDLDVLERNLREMAEHCRSLGIALRPHTKTHKIPEIARQQMRLGAIGICCQKLGEAEAMAAAGLEDIFILYNLVGKIKVERLLRLVRQATIAVTCDSEETALGISEQAAREGIEVRMVVELDTGGRRCGVQSPQAALELAQKISQQKGLVFQGIMTYPSRREARAFLEETVGLLRQHGLPARMISGGGTGAEATSKKIGCTEHRSGSYAWEGLTRIGNSEQLHPDRNPLRMLCTVVSAPTSQRIILDGGQKTFTSYSPNPYGHVVEFPEARIYGMSVEHGHVDMSQCTHRFRVGERVSVIPLHGGMTTNLHDMMYGVRGERVETIWEIVGRGKVQ